MNISAYLKSLQLLHSAFFSLAAISMGVSLIFTPPSLSTAQKLCKATNLKPMWITGSTILVLTVILYFPYMHVSSVLKKPTDENPHPHMSKRVCYMFGAYVIGLFICGVLIIACFLLAFEVKVARIACLSTATKVVLVNLPVVFALSFICFFYHAYRELLACVRAPAPTAVVQTATPMTEQLMTASAATQTRSTATMITPPITPPVTSTSARPELATTSFTMTVHQTTAASLEMVAHVDSDVSSYADALDIVEITEDAEDIF